MITWEKRWSESGSMRLWTQAAGDGDNTVLLIMGTSTSADGWPDEFVAPLLAAGRRVIRYDHRDTGQSDSVDFATHPYAVDDLAADALAVLDTWQVGDAHVVGISLGGTIAQWLAVHHPARVRSLSLLCTSPMDNDNGPAIARAFAHQPPEPGTLPPPAPAFLDYLTRRVTADPVSADPTDRALDLWRVLAGDDQSFDTDAARHFLRVSGARSVNIAAATNHDPAGRVMTPARRQPIEQISCPALVVHGTADPIYPPEHAQALARRIPTARLAVIPGMGHGLFTVGLPPRIAALLVEHTGNAD